MNFSMVVNMGFVNETEFAALKLVDKLINIMVKGRLGMCSDLSKALEILTRSQHLDQKVRISWRIWWSRKITWKLPIK